MVTLTQPAPARTSSPAADDILQTLGSVEKADALLHALTQQDLLRVDQASQPITDVMRHPVTATRIRELSSTFRLGPDKIASLLKCEVLGPGYHSFRPNAIERDSKKRPPMVRKAIVAMRNENFCEISDQIPDINRWPEFNKLLTQVLADQQWRPALPMMAAGLRSQFQLRVPADAGKYGIKISLSDTGEDLRAETDTWKDQCTARLHSSLLDRGSPILRAVLNRIEILGLERSPVHSDQDRYHHGFGRGSGLFSSSLALQAQIHSEDGALFGSRVDQGIFYSPQNFDQMNYVEAATQLTGLLINDRMLGINALAPYYTEQNVLDAAKSHAFLWLRDLVTLQLADEFKLTGEEQDRLRFSSCKALVDLATVTVGSIQLTRTGEITIRILEHSESLKPILGEDTPFAKEFWRYIELARHVLEGERTASGRKFAEALPYTMDIADQSQAPHRMSGVREPFKNFLEHFMRKVDRCALLADDAMLKSPAKLYLD